MMCGHSSGMRRGFNDVVLANEHVAPQHEIEEHEHREQSERPSHAEKYTTWQNRWTFEFDNKKRQDNVRRAH